VLGFRVHIDRSRCTAFALRDETTDQWQGGIVKVCRVLGVLIFLATIPTLSMAGYLGDVSLDKGSVAQLGFGTPIQVNFSYKVTIPDGARIRALPYYDGSPHPNSGYVDSPVYAEGAGIASTLCTVWAGDARVDQIVIVMFTADWNEQLLELALPVDYHYDWVGVFDIAFSPSSPSWLMNGEYLDITYNYNNTWPGPVKVFARPFFHGELCEGYGASGSPSHPEGTGSEDAVITFPSGSADVDAIRFQVWTDDQVSLLNQFFVPVDFHWGSHGISNVSFSVDPPDYRLQGESIDCNFQYSTSDPIGVRVWAYGAKDGELLTDGLFQQGSALLPAPSGSTSRYFGYHIDTDINQVALIMKSDDQSETYLEAFVPLDAKYRAHVIRELDLTPGAPAILNYGEHIDAEWAYATTNSNALRIWQFLYAQGVDKTSGNSASPLYLQPSGYGSSYAYWNNYQEPVIDQIMFKIVDDVTEGVLEEIFYPALHLYGEGGVATSTSSGIPQSARLLPNYPNPFNPKTRLSFVLDEAEQVDLAIYDLQGRLIKALANGLFSAGAHDFEWNGSDEGDASVASGIYFARMTSPGSESVIKLVLLK
jgi:hypothetical protein